MYVFVCLFVCLCNRCIVIVISKLLKRHSKAKGKGRAPAYSRALNLLTSGICLSIYVCFCLYVSLSVALPFSRSHSSSLCHFQSDCLSVDLPTILCLSLCLCLSSSLTDCHHHF